MKIKCYLCNSSRNEIVAQQLRYPSSRKVYKCSDCGLVFLYPQMGKNEEKQFYEKEYGEIFSKEKGTTPADLFVARQGDSSMYRELVLDQIKKGMDCLEIGCASGYFLAAIKNDVRSVSGIESHSLLQEYCKEIGIKMFKKLEECSAESFDMVFMFFVLEHLGDPLRYLKEIDRVLRKSGKLYLVVPNRDDALLSLYDILAFRNYYYTPAHHFYYTAKTLAGMFKKAGLSKFKIKNLQRYDLSNHMHWMMQGRPGGVGKFNNVFSRALNDKYKKDLIKAGRGDTLIAIVNKKEGGGNGKE